MTPKEKAEGLVNKMFYCYDFTNNEEINTIYPHAKKCALIAVDELILDAYNNYFYNYWQEVKKEIEKL
jgi:hypothetical protein